MLADEHIARRRWMGILAAAAPAEVALCLEAVADVPPHVVLRRPEIGLVMVRGRIGGDGAPFNMGEMTVTRCSIRLPSGITGHAWIAGRAPRQAEQAAILDAMLQEAGTDSPLPTMVERLAVIQDQRRAAASRKVAATKVDFFTLVRGED